MFANIDIYHILISGIWLVVYQWLTEECGNFTADTLESPQFCAKPSLWCMWCYPWSWLNTLRPRQNGRHFPDDIFKWIFMNEDVSASIGISLKFVPKAPINNIPALVRIMAWRRPGDKPLSELMMVSLLTHIYICIYIYMRVTWHQWVNLQHLKPQSYHNWHGLSKLVNNVCKGSSFS